MIRRGGTFPRPSAKPPHARQTHMLNQKDAMATVAASDIHAAKRFYEDVLGFTLVHSQQESAFTYRSGNSKLLLYVSRYAGTNQATAVTWDVGTEVDAIVKDLK